jgi:hypothetical protein
MTWLPIRTLPLTLSRLGRLTLTLGNATVMLNPGVKRDSSRSTSVEFAANPVV